MTQSAASSAAHSKILPICKSACQYRVRQVLHRLKYHWRCQIASIAVGVRAGSNDEHDSKPWDRTFSPRRFAGEGEIEDFLHGYQFFYPQSFPADIDDLLGGIRTKRAVGYDKWRIIIVHSLRH